MKTVASKLLAFSFTLTVVGVSVLVVAPMDSARAVVLVPVVDQELIAPEQAALAVTAGESWGQSFTVGLAGPLTRIDFQVGRNAGTSQPLQVELRKTIGDLPDLSPSALLFSGLISASDVPVVVFTSSLDVSLDLSSAPPVVTPGEKLVVLLSTTDGDWYYWINSGYFQSNPYPNGTSVKKGYPDYSNWVVVDDWDGGFRTWVAAVPEPGSGSLLLVAGSILLGNRRRFTKRLVWR